MTNQQDDHAGETRMSSGMDAVSSRPQKDKALPNLCEHGLVVVFTRYYYRADAGTAVVMRNLLSQFDPNSYCVVAGDLHDPAAVEVDPKITVYSMSVLMPCFLPKRSEHLWQKLRQPLMASWAKRLVKTLAPSVIVGVYPDVQFLGMAREAARAARIPWVAYFHDTMVEGASNTAYARWTERLQSQTFAEASSILVTGRGMADLYSRKYGLSCKAVEISYLEPIPDAPPSGPAVRQGFMGGSIYTINACSVHRTLDALKKADCPVVMATGASWEVLAFYGINKNDISKELFRDRAAYLDVLRRQGILIVVLDWPDESPVNEDELATAFPTKAVEYLASGRPILVHCPEHYFLARFFRENRCGLVVSERSTEALSDAVRQLLEGGKDVLEMGRAALSAAHLFAIDRVAHLFQSEVAAAAELKWAEPVRSETPNT